MEERPCVKTYQVVTDSTVPIILQPLPVASKPSRQKVVVTAKYAVIFSLIANVIIFSAKLYASVQTMSMAIIASTVDSMLDLVSQAVVYYAQRGVSTFSFAEYPVGRNRLEPLGVIVCASLMGSASILVLFHAAKIFLVNLHDHTTPVIELHLADTAILIFAVIVKAILFFYCNAIRNQSPSALALAEDHRNDVLSNTMAILTATVAFYYHQYWWVDEIGAIVICAYIIYSWYDVASEQVDMVVGKAASDEFVTKVSQLTAEHDPALLQLDVIRAYHFGLRFLVEVEVVMPRDTILQKSHDVALALQKKIERLEEVERAFVHVDYKTRDGVDEHKHPTSPTHGDQCESSAF